jgi:hypothetical protein
VSNKGQVGEILNLIFFSFFCYDGEVEIYPSFLLVDCGIRTTLTVKEFDFKIFLNIRIER